MKVGFAEISRNKPMASGRLIGYVVVETTGRSWLRCCTQVDYFIKLVARHNAIEVTSVHCPGFKKKGPPPIMSLMG